VLTVHVPAVTAETYQNVMGVEGMASVIENIRQFLTRRQVLGRGAPILAPTFTKCTDNLHEMEAWYDHWLRAVGAAVITGPSDCAAQIPDAAVADMSPPRRGVCRRLTNRLTIRSDGTIVACENDFLARHPLGHVSRDSIADVWQSRVPELRALHAANDFARLPLCHSCRDWHRP
jgi:radical SAM protein with 4Fe4S-binding SPASM domain